MYDTQKRRVEAESQVSGCGPILSVGAPQTRPLRQQIFEAVRAAVLYEFDAKAEPLLREMQQFLADREASGQ